MSDPVHHVPVQTMERVKKILRTESDKVLEIAELRSEVKKLTADVAFCKGEPGYHGKDEMILSMQNELSILRRIKKELEVTNSGLRLEMEELKAEQEKSKTYIEQMETAAEYDCAKINDLNATIKSLGLADLQYSVKSYKEADKSI